MSVIVDRTRQWRFVGEGAAGPTWHRAVGPTILDMAVADLHPIDRTLQHSVVCRASRRLSPGPRGPGRSHCYAGA